MWKHLESLHNEEFVCLKGNGAQKKENESIRSFIVPKKDATIEAEEQIARIMIRQNNSFLFFEDKDLRALYAKANPNLKFLLISTLLDPRFAYDESIFTKLNWSIIEDDLIEYAKRDDIWKPKSPGTVSVPSTLSGENKADLKARLQLQLATFKAIGRPFVDTDIFEWWASNGLQFPDLVVLARIVHSVPATSVSSERLFSKAGLIYSNTLRNRLSGELVEKILIIKANLDQLLLEPNTKLEEEDDEAMDEEVIIDENHFEDFGE
ncbi:hypothetical protein niasHS_003159 [Heterodera schachtii]|uniref:HAT C-terminal dimerisation domain-containing protein n=1 Tax=Heterodera schachtii TaxID=97005 RepID=A0ABD2K9U8_HETSC